MKKHILGLLALSLLPISLQAGAVTVSTGTVHGRPVTILDNGLVRLAVTPEIGGRVLELVNVKTGHNSAKIRLDNIGKRPDDNWTGADYGGFTDVPVPGLGWPGDFWGLTYDLKVAEGKDGAKSIVLGAKAGTIGIERTMTVFPDSTLVRVETRETNLGPAPQKMRVRFHCEMAAGTRADDADDVFYASPEGAKRKNYVVGAEYDRMEILKASGWVALSDTAEKSSVFKVFRADDVQDVFYWAGANEATQLFGNDGAFVGLDWMGAEQTVAPGASIESTEDMFLATGLARPDFVDTRGLVAGELATDRPTYGSKGTVALSASLASANARPAAKVAVTITGPDGTKAAELSADIPASAPGQAATAVLKWDYKDVPDGAFFAKAVFSDASGNALGSAERSFAVDAAMVDALVALLEGDRKLLAALKARAKSPPLQVATELRVLDQRLEAAAADLAAGSYASLRAGLETFRAETAKLESLLPKR